jgi:hypothetical protein
VSDGIKATRAFDPRRIGGLECDAWVAYYRRQWIPLLKASIGLTRGMFALPWPATLYGAWLVLRGNQLWAPADNDPAACRRVMERFYRLVVRHHRERFDPGRAAELEVEWWRVHREHQHAAGSSAEPLVDALAALYAHTYDCPVADVRRAAEQRALAMDISDCWVAEGCERASPLVIEERAALVRSYAALLSAVHRP